MEIAFRSCKIAFFNVLNFGAKIRGKTVFEWLWGQVELDKAAISFYLFNVRKREKSGANNIKNSTVTLDGHWVAKLNLDATGV